MKVKIIIEDEAAINEITFKENTQQFTDWLLSEIDELTQKAVLFVRGNELGPIDGEV